MNLQYFQVYIPAVFSGIHRIYQELFLHVLQNISRRPLIQAELESWQSSGTRSLSISESGGSSDLYVPSLEEDELDNDDAIMNDEYEQSGDVNMDVLGNENNKSDEIIHQ
ncbi:hypothetical protein JTB14_013185 [Gonioctena quinquepunctata]|nr:hypothetical protein JTB14_013185 [Gonioctena quinquepunctata]